MIKKQLAKHQENCDQETSSEEPCSWEDLAEPTLEELNAINVEELETDDDFNNYDQDLEISNHFIEEDETY